MPQTAHARRSMTTIEDNAPSTQRARQRRFATTGRALEPRSRRTKRRRRREARRPVLGATICTVVNHSEIICNKKNTRRKGMEGTRGQGKGNIRQKRAPPVSRAGCHQTRGVTHQHAAYIRTVRTALAQGRDSHTTESLTPNPGGGGGGRPGTRPSRTALFVPSSRTSLRSSTHLLPSVSSYRRVGRARGTCPGRRRGRRTARAADTSASSTVPFLPFRRIHSRCSSSRSADP